MHSPSSLAGSGHVRTGLDQQCANTMYRRVGVFEGTSAQNSLLVAAGELGLARPAHPVGGHGVAQRRARGIAGQSAVERP